MNNWNFHGYIALPLEDYADMPVSKIPKEKAIKMFKEFNRLINL